jgi:hypothetical protein
MLLLGFSRGGMVVDRLLEALARDRVLGLSAPPPASLPLNAFLLLLFRSIAKIFSWRCDSHFQGEMRRGDGATVLSGATILHRRNHRNDFSWVGPGWAVEDAAGAGSIMLKERMR